MITSPLTKSRFTKSFSLLLMFCLLSLALPANAQRQRANRRAIGNKVLNKAAQRFIDDYTAEYQRLYTASSNAEWDSNTRIVEGDETNAQRTKEANERIAAFTGSTLNVALARRFLNRRRELASLQVKQLERIIYHAGASPESARETVRERIAAETRQNEKLYGYTFKIDGKPVTPNQIDEILRTSTNVEERRKAWLASKEVGKELRDGLSDLQRLRNAVVAPLGYKSFNTYQVAEYGMSAEEMQSLMDGFLRELRPLYRELHTYARYELAKRYNQPVPDELPADWLPNRWAQNWSSMVEVEGLNINDALKQKSPEWIVRQAEDFYVSLGFPPLPESFYTKSSLYPLAADSPFKKNTHASAWHIDLNNDLRSLMSVETNADWYETTHHELGHIYYYVSYTRPQVPVLLRAGANRAYHEAFGTMLGLASTQKPFLVGRGLASADAKTDDTQLLLKEALNYVVYMPFAAGVMSGFEYDLYDGKLPTGEYNKRWWELVRKYQGIVPPAQRGEGYADAATKTHINDDPAQYYDYALSTILLFQIHDHIARKILHQDPRATNYYGNKEVGAFLRRLMEPGASREWRTVLREAIGEDLSANAMLRYFAPLTAHLKEVNKGRRHTLPAL